MLRHTEETIQLRAGSLADQARALAQAGELARARDALAEARELAGWICDILDDIGNPGVIETVRAKVLAVCKRFPVYGG